MRSTTSRNNKSLDLGEVSLGNFDVFKGLETSDINLIVEAGLIRSVDRGKLLFRKGDIDENVYLVLKGMIQIVDEYEQHKKVLAELGPGEFFGEMSMLERAHKRSTHAAVKETSQVLVLRNRVLNDLIDNKMPKRFLKNIIGVLCQRIHTNKNMYMRAKYYDKSSKDVNWQG